MDQVHILPGRHQPPHNDHFAIIEAALRLITGPLYVGLIVHRPVSEPASTELEHEARQQNGPERSPFSFDQRRRLVEAGLDERLSPHDRPRVQVIALPRPEASWDLIEAIFPESRAWIIPDLGEAFDDLKARFFASRGDAVIRIPFSATTDGYRVRRCLEHSDRGLDEHVPPSVSELIRQWRHS